MSNTINYFLIQPYSYDTSIYVSYNKPLEIGQSINMNNGFYSEPFTAFAAEPAQINGTLYTKISLRSKTDDIKDIYFKEKENK